MSKQSKFEESLRKYVEELIGHNIEPHKIYFRATIGNVDKSFLQLDLGRNFNVETFGYKKYVKFHSEAWQSSELDIECAVQDGYYASRKKDDPKRITFSKPPKEVYIVTKTIDCTDPFSEKREPVTDFSRLDHWCNWTSDDIKRQVNKLRLLIEGDIHIPAEFFLDYESAYSESRCTATPYVGNRPFKVSKADVEHINCYLKHSIINSEHNYLKLALNNFFKSYEINDLNLEFLVLMIVLEGLFNSGRQESTQKIARGCAVLLGKTKPFSDKIFKEIKYLYGKRSGLVHEGDNSCIKKDDVLLLKNYVRKCLRHCLELNLSKDGLTKLLNETGFGQAKTFIAKGRTSRQKKLFPILTHFH